MKQRSITSKECFELLNSIREEAKENKRDSYTIVGEKVRAFWRETYPQNCIAFFEQKYTWEDKWDEREELIECNDCGDYETVIFENDFCEGQTDVRNVIVVSLNEVCDLYRDRIINTQLFLKGARNEP